MASYSALSVSIHLSGQKQVGDHLHITKMSNEIMSRWLVTTNLMNYFNFIPQSRA